MPVNATGRNYITDLLKGKEQFSEDAATRYHFETVGVEGSGAITNSNIGLPLIWDETAVAFVRFTANAARADSTAYSVGDIVRPVTRDGNEYVCQTAGTSAGSAPTFITTAGAETTDGAVTWVARKAYAVDGASTSPLKNKSRICVTVGSEFGVGFNKNDRVLSATPMNFTVIYRGQATLINEGFLWGTVAAEDQAEFLSALEDLNITTIDNATVVTPTFTS